MIWGWPFLYKAKRIKEENKLEDVRKVGDYTVLHAMYIGHKEIVLCENADAKPNERYLCCYVENIAIFERYSDAIVSDDFAELVKEYGTRITEAAAEIIRETEKANADVGSNEEITPANCKAITYEDSLVNKVVVIRGDILRPEFRHASRQLMLCTGGFGAEPHSRGRTCFCTNLYDGKQTSYYRSDILGIIEEENLPQWAKSGLEKAQVAIADRARQQDDAR